MEAHGVLESTCISHQILNPGSAFHSLRDLGELLSSPICKIEAATPTWKSSHEGLVGWPMISPHFLSLPLTAALLAASPGGELVFLPLPV